MHYLLVLFPIRKQDLNTTGAVSSNPPQIERLRPLLLNCSSGYLTLNIWRVLHSSGNYTSCTSLHFFSDSRSWWIHIILIYLSKKCQLPLHIIVSPPTFSVLFNRIYSFYSAQFIVYRSTIYLKYICPVNNLAQSWKGSRTSVDKYVFKKTCLEH